MSLRLAFAALAVGFFAGIAIADSPIERAISLAPKSATLHIAVQDARSHWANWKASPFAATFLRSDFARSAPVAELLESLRKFDGVLNEHLESSLQQLVDDVFGDAAVLSFVPEAGTEGYTVLTVVAPKPDAMAAFVAKLNDVQSKSGELKAVREKKHGEAAYTERERADGRSDYIWLGAKGEGAYTSSEAAIKLVIDRSDKPETSRASASWKTLTVDAKAGTKNPAVAVIFDPKALVADAEAREKSTDDPAAKAFLKQIRAIWNGIDSLLLTASFDTEVTLAIHAKIDRKTMPKEMLPLLDVPKTSAAIWQSIPNVALFAVGGRLDASRWWPVLTSFLPGDIANQWNAVGLKTIAPAIGKEAAKELGTGSTTEWGFWLMVPEGLQIAPDWCLAVRLPDAGAGLLAGLDFLVQSLRVEYHKSHDDQFDVTDEKDGDATFKSISNDAVLPVGIRPSFGLRGSDVVVASSPLVWKRYRQPAKPGELDAPLAFLRGAAFAKYWKERRADLAPILAGWTGETKEAVETQFDELFQMLELIDRLEVRTAGDAGTGTIAIKLRIVPIRPLKK